MGGRTSKVPKTWSTTTASFVQIGGLRIRYRVFGTGRPLLLIMGIGANLDMWQPLIPALSGHEVIAFDAPGTGGSATPRLPRSMRQNADVVRVLLDRLGLPAVDVLGLSWGGLLAQKFAIDHPTRVRRLVLAATMPGWPSIPGRPSALRHLLSPKRYYSSAHFTEIAGDLYGGRVRQSPEVVLSQLQHRVTRPPSPSGYFAQIASTWTYSGLLSLHRVKAPTLVLAGNDDPIIPERNSLIFGRLIPNVTVEVVDGGHLFLLDGTPGVGERVATFLESHD